MTAPVPHLQPVDLHQLPDYPVDPGVRLDSHKYINWEFKRWLGSDLRWNGDHECKSIWFELVNLAHDQTPVGTLPSDLRRLARMVQPAIEPDRFERLCAQPYGPLHGWHPCRVGDQVRLMHPTVTRIVIEALASRANHEARNDIRSLQARLRRLTEDVAQVAPRLAQDARCIRFINDHVDRLVEQRGGQRRTERDLHDAIQACIEKQNRGGFPGKV